jgi:hypothetical protein
VFVAQRVQYATYYQVAVAARAEIRSDGEVPPNRSLQPTGAPGKARDSRGR